MDCSYSSSFFDEIIEFDDSTFIQLKVSQLIWVFKKILCLPFFLLEKLLRTFFLGLGVLKALIGVVLSLGFWREGRDILQRRGIKFAEEICDWLLYPFGIIVFLSRSFVTLSFKNRRDDG